MWRKEMDLYPYQQEAAEVMTKCNVLLAFEMGCGKTPTTLWAIEKLRELEEIDGAGIIIAPSSLLWQWEREIYKFTTSSAVVISGSPKSRDLLYVTASRYDYVIMTYDTFVRDAEKIHRLNANAFLVLDEATAIKTFKAKRTKELKRVKHVYPIRFALSGTPVENGKPEELFSILEWVDPDIAGPWHKFESAHLVRNSMGWVEGYRAIDSFYAKVKGNILRKRADDPDVSKYLPEVITPDPISVSLDVRSWDVYSLIVNELLVDLEKAAEKLSLPPAWDEEDPDHPDGKMMSKIQTARMMLDHPFAVYSSAARYEDPDDPRGSKYAAGLVRDGFIDKVKAPKFDALGEYIYEFLGRDPKNKAVVFCSFVDVAEQIHINIPGSVMFTGDLSAKERDAVVTQFKTQPGTRVFISTDAGGYGLDLPQANLIVNFDMPWQEGLLKQRNARIRRASSEWKHVVVQDFVVKRTIEERLRQMIHHKSAVAEAFVDGKGILDDGTLGSDPGTLRRFLTDLFDDPEVLWDGAIVRPPS